jgi:hypothetical protein
MVVKKRGSGRLSPKRECCLDPYKSSRCNEWLTSLKDHSADTRRGIGTIIRELRHIRAEAPQGIQGELLRGFVQESESYIRSIDEGSLADTSPPPSPIHQLRLHPYSCRKATKNES